jgi:hypothetical protein
MQLLGWDQYRRGSPKTGICLVWIIRANGHAGTGVFTRVASIQRVNTKGGSPPPACDESLLGSEMKIPYSDDYCFYGRRG